MQEIDTLDDDFDGLNATLGDASGMVRAFSSQLTDVRRTLNDTNRDLAGLERGFSGGLRRAFDGLVLNGASLSDTLSSVARSMVNTTYSAAITPITSQLGGLLAGGVNHLYEGMIPFAQGGSFSQGRVMPFARGGVVSGPTAFPMRGGTGLMGEAGPEAIMPLTRGSDGAPRGGRARRRHRHRQHEHHHARCAGFRPLAGPDRGPDGASARPRPEKPLINRQGRTP